MRRIKSNLFATFVLASIPCFILVAPDGSFMVQSIIIPIILLLLYVLLRRKICIGHVDSIAITLHILAISTSGIINILFFPDLITELYVIRILYFVTILVFYYCSVGLKFDRSAINIIFEINILAACLIAFYFIFVDEIWYVNLVGTRIDKNFSAGLMALQGELALLRFFESNKPVQKVKYIILYTIVLYGVFLSHSRASMLAILGGSVLISYDCFLKIRYWNIRHVIKKVIVILSILVLFGFLVVPVIIQFLTENESTRGFLSVYFDIERYFDKSNQSRLDIWYRALRMWTERPMFGHGIGAVHATNGVYGSAVAHDTYIDYLVDQGIVGFVAFLLILFQSFRKIFRGSKKRYRAIPITLVLLSIVVSATRSVMLWNFLVICRIIGNCDDEADTSVRNTHQVCIIKPLRG